MRSARWLSLVALSLAALAACGGSSDGGGVTPPPPPPPPITRIVLASHDALVLMGRKIPVASLVLGVYDSTGAKVANPILTVSAPQGWTVQGDTLIAPLWETRGWVRVSASRPVATGRLAAPAAYGAAPLAASAIADSLAVTSGLDLRAHQWTMTARCDGGGAVTDSSVLIDSLEYDHVHVDSILYADAPSGWYEQWGGVAQLHWSGRMIWWLHDGTTDTTTSRPQVLPLFAQRPDSLLFYDVSHLSSWSPQKPSPDSTHWATIKADSVPVLRYVGGTMCTNNTGRRGLLTLEEVQP